MAGKCRNAFSLSTKIAVIDAVEAGERTKSEVAKSFNMPSSTLSTILKNKVKLREMFNLSKIDSGRKHLHQLAYGDLEEALFLWFTQARTINVPVSGPILKIKAKELALQLGHHEFSCSTGWLERFKTRHGIIFKKITGEEGSVTDEMIHEWRSS